MAIDDSDKHIRTIIAERSNEIRVVLEPYGHPPTIEQKWLIKTFKKNILMETKFEWRPVPAKTREKWKQEGE